jgi:hypothetical protein
MSSIARAGLVVGLVAVTALNSVVVGRRVLVDDDGPRVGRAAVAVMVGLPLALVQSAGLAALWWTLTGA